MKPLLTICAFVVFAAAQAAWSDSITANGRTYTDVYLREGPSMYYIQVPADGSVLSVPKTSVRPEDVSLTEGSERDALLVAWKEKYAVRQERLGLDPNAGSGGYGQTEASRERLAAAARRASKDRVSTFRRIGPKNRMPRPQPARSIYAPIVVDGVVHHVDLRNVSLRDALRAILRSKNLDYAVQNGIITVDTPERVGPRSYRDLETRLFTVLSQGGTLPKIVVGNPGGNGRVYAATGGRGGGSFGGGGAAFSNISQLFSTYDDLLVGEIPNLIVQRYGR